MDREKVIKGIQECDLNGGLIGNCPYKGILSLLKEQEAVEPKKVKGYNPPMYTIYEYECKECKSPMMNKQPFCMGCGRSVKWE